MTEMRSEGGAVPAFHLGHRMDLALEYAGIAKGDMANYLGVSPATVLRWTKLMTPVKRHVLLSWAMRCGVSPEWLEHGEAGGTPPVNKRYDVFAGQSLAELLEDVA